MNNNLRLSIVVLVVVILGSVSVSALGITPGKSTFDFEPGAQRKVSFSVVNSEARDMSLVVLIQGELNQSISVSEVAFKMSSDERSKELTYILTMPLSLKPGLHTSEVVVVQLPEKSAISEAFVGAAVGVATQVYVFVPYPGKYAEASLNVIGPDDNGEIVFVMPVISRGDLDLVKVRGLIEIYGQLNEKIATLNTNEVAIPSGQRMEIVATWIPNVPSGTYRAVATVLYDEGTLTLEKQFNVGSRLLDLQNIEVNGFSLGEIAKFELLVENKWSEVIMGAYANLLIYNNEGEVMADIKSPSYDVPALEKILMVAFWDTAGVRKGIYDSSVFLRYGQQSVQQDFKLEVKDNEINVIGIGYVISRESAGGGLFDNTLVVVLIVVIALLVIINLLWFLVLRKKLTRINVRK